MLQKLTAFTKIVAGLPDVPSPAMSPLQIKQWFDTAPEEMRVAFNALIDALGATTTGDSGAKAIGLEPVVGISASNVQTAIEQLRIMLNDATAGSIPDGTITPAKLSFDPATQPELDAHATDNTKHTPYAIATGAANTYVITLTPAPSSYVEGTSLRVKINALNSGASTININGMGAKSIKKASGNDVLAGNLKVGIVYTLTYNGVNFILQGEGGEYGTAVASQVLAPNTIGTEAGVIPGTMVDRGQLTVTPSGAVQNFPGGSYTGVAVNPSGGGVSAGNTINIYNVTSSKAVNTASYTRLKYGTILVSGTYRVTFSIGNSSNTIFGSVYKNGVPLGLERSTTGASQVSFTEDLTFSAGDVIEIWCKANNTGFPGSTTLLQIDIGAVYSNTV